MTDANMNMKRCIICKYVQQTDGQAMHICILWTLTDSLGAGIDITHREPYISTCAHRSQSWTADRASSSSSFHMFSLSPPLPMSHLRLPFSHLIFSNSSWLLSALLPTKRCPPVPLPPCPSAPLPALYHVCSPPPSLLFFVHYSLSLLFFPQLSFSKDLSEAV